MAKLSEIIKNSNMDNKTIKVNKVPVTIQTRLSSEDFVSCVNAIVDNCTVDNVFHIEFKEIVKRNAYLMYFTDIDLSGYTSDEVFELSQSDWFDEIFKYISDTPIYYAIESAVEEMFNNRKSSFDKLCDTLSDVLLTHSSSEDISDIKEVLKGLSRVDKNAFINAVVKKKRKK